MFLPNKWNYSELEETHVGQKREYVLWIGCTERDMGMVGPRYIMNMECEQWKIK